MQKQNPKIYIDGNSKRYGIIGYPLKHTLSPLMQNGMISYYKLPAFYFPLEISPDVFCKTAKNLRYFFEGFNVTVPYKEAMINYLDEICIASKKIGAVNTVYIKNGDLIGTNTDWKGFADSLLLDYKVSLKDKNILILGAGGSARACFYAACQQNAKSVIIANRTFDKAEKIISDISFKGIKTYAIGISANELRKESHNSDVIINTTSIGLNKKENHYFSFKEVNSKAFVYDLIYSHETNFIKEAKKRKLNTGNGLKMLVRQGAYSFEYWFNINPDIKKMFSFIKNNNQRKL